MQSFTLFACKNFYLLFVKNNSVELWIARLENPVLIAVFLHELVQKPGFLLAIIANDLYPSKSDDTGVKQGRIAGSAAALLHRANFGYFNASPRILFKIGEEMSIVSSRVHKQRFTSFIDVNQRNNIGPAVLGRSPYVGSFLFLQKFARIGIFHLPDLARHLSAMPAFIVGHQDSLSFWPGEPGQTVNCNAGKFYKDRVDFPELDPDGVSACSA